MSGSIRGIVTSQQNDNSFYLLTKDGEISCRLAPYCQQRLFETGRRLQDFNLVKIETESRHAHNDSDPLVVTKIEAIRRPGLLFIGSQNFIDRVSAAMRGIENLKLYPLVSRKRVELKLVTSDGVVNNAGHIDQDNWAYVDELCKRIRQQVLEDDRRVKEAQCRIDPEFMAHQAAFLNDAVQRARQRNDVIAQRINEFANALRIDTSAMNSFSTQFRPQFNTGVPMLSPPSSPLNTLCTVALGQEEFKAMQQSHVATSLSGINSKLREVSAYADLFKCNNFIHDPNEQMKRGCFLVRAQENGIALTSREQVQGTSKLLVGYGSDAVVVHNHQQHVNKQPDSVATASSSPQHQPQVAAVH